MYERRVAVMSQSVGSPSPSTLLQAFISSAFTVPSHRLYGSGHMRRLRSLYFKHIKVSNILNQLAWCACLGSTTRQNTTHTLDFSLSFFHSISLHKF